MLGIFMEEMNITPEQFEIACLEGKNLSALPKDEPSDSHSFSFHKGLFQQIWAANDIRIFVRLMVQRNVEIQLQALDLIEQRQMSFQENENGDDPSEKEIDQIEKFVEAEINLKEDTQSGTESDDKFKRLNLFFEQERVKTTDVSKRQEYLRTQRDKILQIKKQARARQLNEVTKERPTSAMAAKKVIDGERVEADEASVQIRKLLARKLREEVVDKSSQEWVAGCFVVNFIFFLFPIFI